MEKERFLKASTGGFMHFNDIVAIEANRLGLIIFDNDFTTGCKIWMDVRPPSSGVGLFSSICLTSILQYLLYGLVRSTTYASLFSGITISIFLGLPATFLTVILFSLFKLQ